MIDRLKENAFLCFTLSLVASYFACFGYYSFFHIDITSFLSIQDLSIIFAKWIWLSGSLVIMTTAILYSFFKRVGNQDNWWDKTLGRTLIKRRALIILPIIILIIISAFVFKIVGNILAVTMGIGLAILIIVAILAVIISFLKDKREISEIAFKEWFYLIASLYIFIFIIPFFGGIVTARNLKADKIYVRFDDDNILNSTDSTTLTYIGKTSDYFFITNSKTKTTTAYSMDKVKSFEVITEKK